VPGCQKSDCGAMFLASWEVFDIVGSLAACQGRSEEDFVYNQPKILERSLQRASKNPWVESKPLRGKVIPSKENLLTLGN